MAHDWILRRVILDDSFVPAMNYLSTKVVGDEVALRELYRNVEQQRSLVEELQGRSRCDRGGGQQQVRHPRNGAGKTRGGGRGRGDRAVASRFYPCRCRCFPKDSDVSVEAAKERADTARADAERKERERRDVQAQARPGSHHAHGDHRDVHEEFSATT